VNTTMRRHRLSGAGLGTIAIGSAVGDVDVTIVYEIPGSADSTTSRGSTLDREPASAGAVVIDEDFSACYETGLKVADLDPGDHIYTVVATLEGRVLSGSTIFTIPAA